jgi:hypothetical protein
MESGAKGAPGVLLVNNELNLQIRAGYTELAVVDVPERVRSAAITKR